MERHDFDVAHRVRPLRVARRRSRRGRFARYWVARCRCGWRGPGRTAQRDAVADVTAHLEAEGVLEPRG